MIDLTSVAGLDQALRSRGPVVLFKHSTQCPVSAAADAEYRSFAGRQSGAGTFTHLDLLAHRDVSNAIAARFGVPHESPQLIIVRGGRVSAVLNHDAITGDALGALLAS
jgi:bacillithiol system protein YtxJ